jgi:hypothetical protein
MNLCKKLKCSYCCEVLEITAKREQDYYKMRGCEINGFTAIIRMPCPNLKDGDCMIYDQERPRMCKDYICQKLDNERRTSGQIGTEDSTVRLAIRDRELAKARTNVAPEETGIIKAT